jgi:hypothetical protein
VHSLADEHCAWLSGRLQSGGQHDANAHRGVFHCVTHTHRTDNDTVGVDTHPHGKVWRASLPFELLGKLACGGLYLQAGAYGAQGIIFMSFGRPKESLETITLEPSQVAPVVENWGQDDTKGPIHQI